MKAGYSLVETIISVGMFTLLAAALFVVARAGTAAWLKVDAQNDAEVHLRKAELALLRDLEGAVTGTGAGNLSIERVGAGDGFAVWFPTGLFYDAAGEPQIARGETGQIYGVDTILYYCVRPQNHGCGMEPSDTGDSSFPPEGDRFCPHKQLIRKVIHGSGPFDAATIRGLYCTRPAGRSLEGMSGEPQLDLTVQAPRNLGELLLFAASKAPATRQVTVTLGGFRTREAEKSIRIGSSNLTLQRFLVPHVIRLYPAN